MDIAAAAAKVAHESSGGPLDEEEIPEAPIRQDRGGARDGGGGKPRRAQRGPRDKVPEGMTRLFVGAGRIAGVRPQDLVGAIAGEADIPGREIGAIQIADRFSLVDVPANRANAVIQALRGTSLKGRKVTVRRERYTPK